MPRFGSFTTFLSRFLSPFCPDIVFVRCCLYIDLSCLGSELLFQFHRFYFRPSAMTDWWAQRDYYRRINYDLDPQDDPWNAGISWGQWDCATATQSPDPGTQHTQPAVTQQPTPCASQHPPAQPAPRPTAPATTTTPQVPEPQRPAPSPPATATPTVSPPAPTPNQPVAPQPPIAGIQGKGLSPTDAACSDGKGMMFKGKDGKDGKDGKHGKDFYGKDGKDFNGKDGKGDGKVGKDGQQGKNAHDTQNPGANPTPGPATAPPVTTTTNMMSAPSAPEAQPPQLPANALSRDSTTAPNPTTLGTQAPRMAQSTQPTHLTLRSHSGPEPATDAFSRRGWPWPVDVDSAAYPVSAMIAFQVQQLELQLQDSRIQQREGLRSLRLANRAWQRANPPAGSTLNPVPRELVDELLSAFQDHENQVVSLVDRVNAGNANLTADDVVSSLHHIRLSASLLRSTLVRAAGQ